MVSLLQGRGQSGLPRPAPTGGRFPPARRLLTPCTTLHPFDAVLYMLWAYTPSSMLEAHGVAYYPSKYWAVALPAWACVTVVFVFWLYERCVGPPPGSKLGGRTQACAW